MAVAERVIANSSRLAVRQFISEILDGSESIDTLDVLRATREAFGEDHALREELFTEGIRALVVETIQSVTHQRRDQRMLDRNARVTEMLATVFEPVGDNKRKSILTMTRRDLLHAASERKRQADGLLRWARLEVALAGEMPKSSLATVGEHFTEPQLKRIWDAHMGGDPPQA